MNARDKLLGGLSENSARVYEQVFDLFWEWASARYSAPSSTDSLTWLSQHRADELKPHAPDPLHCERIATEWMISLKDSDLAESSAERYRAVLNAIFCSSSPSSSWCFARAAQTREWGWGVV